MVLEKGSEAGRVKWEEKKERLTFRCGGERPRLLGDTDVVSAHLELEGGWVSMADSKPAMS